MAGAGGPPSACYARQRSARCVVPARSAAKPRRGSVPVHTRKVSGWRLALLLMTWAGSLAVTAPAQVTITRIELRTDPPGGRVRPLESIPIQVRVYGRLGDKEGRVRRDGAKVEILDPGGGWLSKPFHFQGPDEGEFLDEYETTLGRIFGRVTAQYLQRDAVLYTAPETPGRYRIRASLEGHEAEIAIEVDPAAPSVFPEEKVEFGPEPVSLDPYRDLAEHYAPFIAQETWFDPRSDFLRRFDFDGDWNGGNNWENAWQGSSQAYVYYTAMETATHWFLIYNFFHARDYSDNCVAGTCHENDNEGIILTIAKDGSPYGRLEVMETLAHNNVYSFVADRRIRNGVHDIDGEIELHEGSHPVIFIESGGHGIYGSQCVYSRYVYREDRFTAGTGVTYVYEGRARRPRHANDRRVGYELLPIYTHWWLKATPEIGKQLKMFDDFFRYEPAGGRPRAALEWIGGAFYGRAEAVNKAKPFWGWHDTRTLRRGILAVGQWGLDPAYAVSRNLRFPAGEEFSLEYWFNPYLEVGGGGR